MGQGCDYFQKSHSLNFFYISHQNPDNADQHIKITTIVVENSFKSKRIDFKHLMIVINVNQY